MTSYNLQHPYVGGNQSWLTTADPYLARVGCGVVAFADLLAYRAAHHTAEDTPHAPAPAPTNRPAYCTHLRQFSRAHCRPRLPTGMSGWALAWRMGQYYARYLPARRVYWVPFAVVHDPLAAFRAQLAQDFPVILTLPPYYGGKPLPLYRARTCTDSQPYRAHGGHFVTLIAIHTAPHGDILEIVSWGRRYFVRYCDYLRVLSQPIGWLAGGWIEIYKSLPFTPR